jgi:hypothetical protein
MIRAMLNFIFRFFLTFSIFIGISNFAKADLAHRNIPMFQPRRLQLGFETQYFHSNSNYLDNGTQENFPAGIKFLTYDLVINSMYDLSDEWGVSGDLGLAYAESFNSVDLRNSRKLKDLKLGIYRLYETHSFGRFIVDAYYSMSFVSNSVNKDETSVGDGISWLQGGVWWEPGKNKEDKSNSYEKFTAPSAFQPNLRTYLGFRSRASLSDVLIYKIHPQFKYKKYVFGGEMNGTLSIFKEAASSKVQRDLLNQLYNAASSRYNAWNPNILELMAWAGYQPKPYSQFRFGVSQVVGLENTANGFGLFFDWQTSMTMTSSGMIFSNFFDGSNKANPKKNSIQIKDYGPEPKKEVKTIPSDLQDL